MAGSEPRLYDSSVNPENPYSPPALPKLDEYSVAWTDLRRRRKLAWVAVAVVLPLGFLSVPFVPQLSTYVSSAMIVLIVSAIGRVTQFPCPQCGKGFGGKGFRELKSLSSRKCSHCGIVVGTPKPEADNSPAR
jgi:hypothetical protein